MANMDTMKDALAGKATAVPVTKTGEVLDPVQNIEWNADELAAIRAIQRAMTTSRKPVTTDDVVKDLRKALATKAKTTFYTPFETEFKNAERVATRMKRPIETTMTEYMHKNVPMSAWDVMVSLGCKLDVVPPKTATTSPDSPVDTPVAETPATDAKPAATPKK